MGDMIGKVFYGVATINIMDETIKTKIIKYIWDVHDNNDIENAGDGYEVIRHIAAFLSGPTDAGYEDAVKRMNQLAK